ncbi:MAG: hypothetical protein LUC90_05075 [Lachnospiraceae bacterium]|nr:hypothetical protein [Lachnospiraceae bacterium]
MKIKEYYTVGFFDGMETKRLDVDYNESGLKELWRYNLDCTIAGKGQYSYQNVFCFSCDSWNQCGDEAFWSYETNAAYPLTFVVFLQLKNYLAKENSIEDQCRCFSQDVTAALKGKGVAYAYGTVDKNDIVVCIKCRNYSLAVETIKKLHETGEEIVYSYTIFSVSYKVLSDGLTKGSYEDIYSERLPSICLKGIANTFDPYHNYTVDHKYYEFCDKLVTAIYGSDEKQDADYKIYDILGDDDFRLIARNVSLGKLLEQFAPGGLLCCEEKQFQFYLYSSSMVLNTLTPERDLISEDKKVSSLEAMTRDFATPVCDELQVKMTEMLTTVQKPDSQYGERAVTFCHAMWQLLRSLKALEVAPTKKYDFYSLYRPFSMLVDIVSEKMKENTLESKGAAKKDSLENNKEIYDFIHKISMTLHGTLRTDIRFFQIRDFNAIVHYAPAKLRAFYAIWSLELSDYYNSFCPVKNQYSFIFSPGMFRDISVKELFTDYAATKRLMLIVLPERNLYSPDWLMITLAHEVSHFVGYTVRNRPFRHKAMEACCCRILELELRHFEYILTGVGLENEVEKYIKDDRNLLPVIRSQIEAIDRSVEQKEEQRLGPHLYHSRNSISRILEVFRDFGANNVDKLAAEENAMLNRYLNSEAERQGLCRDTREMTNTKRELLRQSRKYEEQLVPYYHRFQDNALNAVLGILRYVMAETCADLNAVLTLSLSPTAYIHSFTDENNHGRDGLTDEEHTTIRSVRIGLVMKAVEKLVKDNVLWFEENEPEFYSVWTVADFRVLASRADVESIEGKLTLAVYSYTENIRRCSNRISAYESIYDDRFEKQTFTNQKLDFFNDKVIWDELNAYLGKCAGDYMEALRSSNEILRSKDHLADVYRKACGSSAVEMMMNIETFLQQYEERC